MNYRTSLGKLGEDLAADWLKKRGYMIVARNIKLSYQELDIVARQGDILVFIEVKTRTINSAEKAEEAMNYYKTQKLKRAISLFLRQAKLKYKDLRLDLIAVKIDKARRQAKLKHYKNVG
jgi:putative endonuclease